MNILEENKAYLCWLVLDLSYSLMLSYKNVQCKGIIMCFMCSLCK